MNILLYSKASNSNPSQLTDLRSVCEVKNWTVAGEFEDVMTNNRPALDALVARVEQGGVEAVVATKLDRLGRSIYHILALIKRLKSLGCAVVCTSQGIDTTNSNPCGEVMANVIAALAQSEKSLMVEYGKAGAAAARAGGKLTGRPSTITYSKDEQAEIVAKWRSEGGTHRELGVLLGGVSLSTALRVERKFVVGW